MATLSGGYAPTGTITWKIFSASDTTCSTPLNKISLTVSVNGAGTYTSPDFTPPAAGSYQSVASYSGDANNTAVSTSCNDRNESSWLSKAGPAMTTSASSGTLTGTVHDVATLSGGRAPTGTISWNVYSVSDASCSTPLNTGPLTATVNGDGTYMSPGFTPFVGRELPVGGDVLR